MEDRIPRQFAVATASRGSKDPLRRMDLDHVHEIEHLGKSSVELSVLVLICQDLHQVGMVSLYQLIAATVPHRQSFDLNHRAVVCYRPAAILSAWLVHERKCILVIDG